MKLKILAYTFSAPLIWVTLLLIKYYAPDLSISRFIPPGVLTGLLIGSFLGRLLIHRRYLTGLTIDNNVINLTYLSSFGIQKQTKYLLDTITEVKIKKKLFLIQDFDSLKLSHDETQSSFSICNDNLTQTIDALTQNIADRLVSKNK